MEDVSFIWWWGDSSGDCTITDTKNNIIIRSVNQRTTNVERDLKRFNLLFKRTKSVVILKFLKICEFKNLAYNFLKVSSLSEDWALSTVTSVFKKVAGKFWKATCTYDVCTGQMKRNCY